MTKNFDRLVLEYVKKPPIRAKRIGDDKPPYGYWITSGGKAIVAKRMGDHDNIAFTLIKKEFEKGGRFAHLSPRQKSIAARRADLFAFERMGGMRVIIYDDTLHYSTQGPPTHQQLRELNDIAIEYGLDKRRDNRTR